MIRNNKNRIGDRYQSEIEVHEWKCISGSKMKQWAPHHLQNSKLSEMRESGLQGGVWGAVYEWRTLFLQICKQYFPLLALTILCVFVLSVSEHLACRQIPERLWPLQIKIGPITLWKKPSHLIYCWDKHRPARNSTSEWDLSNKYDHWVVTECICVCIRIYLS